MYKLMYIVRFFAYEHGTVVTIAFVWVSPTNTEFSS